MSNKKSISPNKHNPDMRPRVVLVNRCFIIDDTGRFLLMQRSAKNRTNPGLWEIPGGKLDEGQDLFQALVREVLEETGYVIEDISKLVFTQSEVIPDGPYEGLPYVVLFSVAKPTKGELTISEEHQDAQWVSYEEAKNYKLKTGIYEALEAIKQNNVI